MLNLRYIFTIDKYGLLDHISSSPDLYPPTSLKILL